MGKKTIRKKQTKVNKDILREFCWRIVGNIKRKFYNVFIFYVLKMRSRRAAILFVDGLEEFDYTI